VGENLIFLKRDGENEARALVLLWLNSDISSKLLDNHLRYCEAKAHTTAIAVLRLREASEELEQLGESLGRYPDSSIIDRARKSFNSQIKVHVNTYMPAKREFDSIS
jgi:hypothetical protein